MKKRLLIVFGLLLSVCAVYFVLLYCGVLHINNPSSEKYPVTGVDVSSHQGTVDWEALASQDIKFAFIKATEGSSFVDDRFTANWADASKTDLRVGAYHFFSFESSGEAQAELFCGTVEPVKNMLPPVIDVEYYGKFKSVDDINVSDIKLELRVLVEKLTDKYWMKPIIYASKETYDTIVREDFSDCDLWIRSVYSAVDSDIDWTFWQYSNRHILKGYSGEERYIDMNVFSGTVEDFASYPKG